MIECAVVYGLLLLTACSRVDLTSPNVFVCFVWALMCDVVCYVCSRCVVFVSAVCLMRLCVVCELLYDVVWCVCLFVLFVCVVFARFACDVWRDGVWCVFCCCCCVCALLICPCDVCMIYCVMLYGSLLVLFCICACGC